MTEHEFVLVLPGVATLATDLADRLFEAGCNDATLSMRAGIAYLDFDRLGRSRAEAVASAVRDAAAAGVPDAYELLPEPAGR